VVIARSDLFPDSLTASVLAASLLSPLLITPKDSLKDVVRQEIERLSPETVYLIGGEGAISKNVENQLKGLPSVRSVIRIAGNDRYETGVRVAEAVASIKGQVRKIIVATGENFPDALSAAPLAGYLGSPIILVKKDLLPPSVVEFLRGFRPQEALIIGGTGVVSDSIASYLSVNYGMTVRRIGGKNRYETSAKLLDYAVREARILSDQSVFLATGENFPDALSSGAPAGLNGIPLLVIKPSYYLDFSTINAAVSLNKLKNIYVAGGTGVLPRSAVSRFFEAVKCGN
jgi:cell wall-associated protease